MAKKKGGKGKGGKGKGGKGKKKGSKLNRDVELSTALNNAKIWAARVDIIEKSRQEYRSACQALAKNNEQLGDEIQSSERDTIDVLSFLKLEGLKKDERIVQLESKLREFDETMKKEKEKIVCDYEGRLRSCTNDANLKEQEIQLLQKELLKVKEFRHKKAVMQEEIETIKHQLYKTTLSHEQAVNNMERRFFDEKIKLEKEAGSRISELAERAHSEAVKQLDMTTRQVYQDNVRLTDALGKHIIENDFLRAENLDLKKSTNNLKNDIETNEKTVKRKILETKRLKESAGELKTEVKALEYKLQDTLSIAEKDKQHAIEYLKASNEKLSQEVYRTNRAISLQSHEMRKLKRAANKVLKDRSNVEQFLITSLEHTRNEIKNARDDYIKTIEQKYQLQMKNAFNGLAPYPKITTFKKQLPHDKSTKSVYDELNEADNFDYSDQPVDISEMTWEQRENILRLLFAQINGVVKANSKNVKSIKNESVDSALDSSRCESNFEKEPLPPIGSRGSSARLSPLNITEDEGNGHQTFLTQGDGI